MSLAVIKENYFEGKGEWHEELLAIQLLGERSLSRRELKDRIRKIQESIFAERWSHSDSAYNYWIRDLMTRGIVFERNKVLTLSGLGRWIAKSSLGTISQRNQFARLSCQNCSSLHHVVMGTPLLDTMTVNRNEVPFADIRCPKCGHLSERCNLGAIGNKDELADFYNQAVLELRDYVTLDVVRL